MCMCSPQSLLYGLYHCYMCIGGTHIHVQCTVQLRGKYTRERYTRECDGLHSRVRARSLAHFRRVLANAPPLARVLLASARPLARVFNTRECSTARSRVLLAPARPLARVLLASAGSSSRALAGHGPARTAVS